MGSRVIAVKIAALDGPAAMWYIGALLHIDGVVRNASTAPNGCSPSETALAVTVEGSMSMGVTYLTFVKRLCSLLPMFTAGLQDDSLTTSLGEFQGECHASGARANHTHIALQHGTFR